MIPRMNWLISLLLLAQSLPLPPTVAPDAQVLKLAQLTGAQTPFAEGTTTAGNGDVYFTDQNYQRIYRWDVSQKALGVFLEPYGRANGQYFDGKGNLLAAADERDQLWQITPAGKHTVIAAKFEEKYFNGPNDIWVRPDGMTIDERGNLYITSGAGASGVTVVDSKTGMAIGFIPVPERPANVAFGGRDHKTLYIAAQTGFYSVDTNVRGANPAK
jgi:sugar lactone lactonase YvrE